MPSHLEVKLLNLSYFWQQYIIYLVFFCWFSMEIMNHFCTSQHMLVFPTACPLECPSHFWSLVRRRAELPQSWEHLVEKETPCYMSGIWTQSWEAWPSLRVREEWRMEEESENRAQGGENDLSHPVISGRLIVPDSTCGKWCTLTIAVICQDWPQKWQTLLW